MKGVLVCADGRTIAVDNAQGAAWWVLARELDYSKRRFFRLADVARVVPNPEHPVFVYTERSQAEWEEETHRRPLSVG